MVATARASRRATVLALLVAVLLASVPVGEVASAGPAAGGVPTAAAGSTTVVDSIEEHRGDVVDLVLPVGNGSTANLSVAAADGSYEATATLVDEDGDGQVTVQWNSYLAGHGGALAAAGEDRVTVRSESTVNGRIPAGTYELAVAVDGDRLDERTVELVPPEDPAVEVMIAVPGVGANLSSASAIRASRRSGSLTPSRRFGVDGRLVLALRAPGLGGALAAQPGTNASERLTILVEQPGFALSVRENSSTVSVELPPIRYGFVGDGARVVADAPNDTYYLVYDIASAPRRIDRRHNPALDHGDWLDVNLTVGPGSGLVDERRSGLLWNLAAVEWQVAPETDVVPYVQSADDQVVVAPTTLPNGTPVTVVLQRPDGSSIRQYTTVRGGPGGARIVTQFDLAGVPPGSSVTVRYLLDGEVVPTDEWRDDEEGTVEVVAERYAVSVDDVERTDADATPVSLQVAATVPDGSLVVVHAENASGRPLGASDRLRDGRHDRTVQVTRSVAGVERLIVVVHADTGDHGRYDRDPVVVTNGTPVAASVDIPVPTPTETATQTATEPRNGADETTVTSDARTVTTPGFGLLAALLAAVVVVLWVGRR